MTVEETIKKLLIQNGLFPKQADEVMLRVKTTIPEMEGHWRNLASDYPTVLLSGLWLRAKEDGLVWIDENIPKAWFRPMFVEPEPA